MTDYRKPDMRVVKLIIDQLEIIEGQAALTGHPMPQDDLIEMVCHMYENKEFIIAEAGLDK